MPLADRFHGEAPFSVAVLHGGPGGAGEAMPLAQEIAGMGHGVFEPMQRARSVAGQVRELKEAIVRNGAPMTIVGWSWGAWLGCLLAAEHPRLVRKLIIVSSGPFEAAAATEIMKTRLERLSVDERRELQHLLKNGFTSENVKTVARLIEKADLYNPIDFPPVQVEFDAEIHQAVWSEAAEMRRSDELMERVRKIRCPVVALHGDYDPGPAEGVRRPLEQALSDFRFHLLSNCGHKPWVERHARQPFREALSEALHGI